MVASIARLLRFFSIAICLVVIASFLTFAVEQTTSASGRQQEQLSASSSTRSAAAAAPGPAATAASHEGTLHKATDEVSEKLTSPFSGIVSGYSSEWAIRSVNLLLALTIYGFGLGYLARVLRVRV